MIICLLLNNKKENKKLFIDVYTQWCGWCKKMDKTTFRNPIIIDYINQNYLPVKFDAEQKIPIEFLGKEYNFVKKGRRGYHELAAALLQNKLSYPTVVFLDENANMIQPLPGYRAAADFHPILEYIGKGHYKNTEWTAYQKSYQAPAGLK